MCTHRRRQAWPTAGPPRPSAPSSPSSKAKSDLWVAGPYGAFQSRLCLYSSPASGAQSELQTAQFVCPCNPLWGLLLVLQHFSPTAELLACCTQAGSLPGMRAALASLLLLSRSMLQHMRVCAARGSELYGSQLFRTFRQHQLRSLAGQIPGSQCTLTVLSCLV